MKKKIIIVFSALFIFLLLGVGHVYYHQEDMLFRKAALPDNYAFSFEEPFEELFFETEAGARINALYFTAEKPKGAVIYFHGRGGNLSGNWGRVSKEFTSRGYDLFIMDYRGFGKSRGKLSERALCHDADYCYNYISTRYPENQIVIYGRSLGTGIATYVASHNDPKNLILESPYFSILDLTPRQLPYLPRFLIPMLLKYHFRTDQWIVRVDSPIHIFHGTEDELVPFDSSTRLLKLIKEKRNASLISIENGKHNHLRFHPTYQKVLDQILQ
ncbi:MAG: alpha/beta fold hydrolase [Simkaniaceae bacterium]|nr:MAG: alpha/beta fold hydrolase [Simkaniaceae bacterium]